MLAQELQQIEQKYQAQKAELFKQAQEQFTAQLEHGDPLLKVHHRQLHQRYSTILAQLQQQRQYEMSLLAQLHQDELAKLQQEYSIERATLKERMCKQLEQKRRRLRDEDRQTSIAASYQEQEMGRQMRQRQSAAVEDDNGRKQRLQQMAQLPFLLKDVDIQTDLEVLHSMGVPVSLGQALKKNMTNKRMRYK